MTQQKITISNETQNYKELQKNIHVFWIEHKTIFVLISKKISNRHIYSLNIKIIIYLSNYNYQLKEYFSKIL